MIPYSFDVTGDGTAQSISSLLPEGYPSKAKWFQVTVKTGTGPEYLGDTALVDDGTGGMPFTAGTVSVPPVAELTGRYDLASWKIVVKSNDKVTILYVL